MTIQDWQRRQRRRALIRAVAAWLGSGTILLLGMWAALSLIFACGQ